MRARPPAGAELEVAEATGHDASDVCGGADEQKEQCIACEWRHPTAGSLSCFCSASSLGIDMRTQYHVVRGTLDPIRCNIFVKSSLDLGGTQRTKSTFPPERVYR